MEENQSVSSPAIEQRPLTALPLRKIRVQQWCTMDKDFPRDTEEGCQRIEFFRTLKVSYLVNSSISRNVTLAIN